MTLELNERVKIKNRPFEGEWQSGDCPFFEMQEGKLHLGLFDVLGHGHEAAKLAKTLPKMVKPLLGMSTDKLIEEIHLNMQGSLGAALSYVQIDLDTGELVFSGVGNVLAFISGSAKKQFVSKDGVLGQNIRTPLLQYAVLKEGDKLVLASDGVQSRCYGLLDDYFLDKSAEYLSSYLIEKFGKSHDDASCLVFEF